MPYAERNKRTAGYLRPNARAERRRAKAAGMLPQQPGVALIPDDDPRLLAASAEANRRFSEFLSALEHRKPGDTFAVKVPFTDDYGREFMWVSVSIVSETHIIGRLDNQPAYVRAVKAGQRVRVPRKGLNDWLFVCGGEMHGGFTLNVVRDRIDDRGGSAA